MKNITRLILFTLTLAISSSIALAADTTDKVENVKLDKALSKYSKVDNVENCISLTRIRESRVIDDQHILFRLSGGKAYLNKLPQNCSQLGFHKAFSYATSINQLCSHDIISVLENSGTRRGTSCGLGKFVEYKKN